MAFIWTTGLSEEKTSRSLFQSFRKINFIWIKYLYSYIYITVPEKNIGEDFYNLEEKMASPSGTQNSEAT